MNAFRCLRRRACGRLRWWTCLVLLADITQAADGKQAIFAPVTLREAPTNETSLIARRDGALELYSITKPASDSVSVLRSRDGGLTWAAPEIAFPLPGRAYYAVQVLEGNDGALHAVAHVFGEGPGGYRGRLYEVYYTRKAARAAEWAPARRVVPGYVGSIRGFIQLKSSGRLLLAVARAIPEREKPPKDGPDLGWHDTFVYFSDDGGATWQQSPDRLTVELKAVAATRYGAIEPAVLHLRDGRVWMLVRDRGGRLWQSFSTDGERWPALERSPFISSDSPATFLRLRDGRVVLFTNACQNWSDPRSYAMGGREVLHAALSSDEGATWRGFREVLHEPAVASRGDRGTAYATAAENSAGQVVFASGQGKGKRFVVAFDPRWLEEKKTRDDPRAGLSRWTSYGAAAVYMEELADGAAAVAIPINAAGLSGAAWNFPLGAAGELMFRVQVPVGATAVRFCLNDHFTRIDDHAAAAHAVFAHDASMLADGRWHKVSLRWKAANRSGELQVEIDGRGTGSIAALWPAQFGVHTLRVEARTDGAIDSKARILISDLGSSTR